MRAGGKRHPASDDYMCYSSSSEITLMIDKAAAC